MNQRDIDRYIDPMSRYFDMMLAYEIAEITDVSHDQITEELVRENLTKIDQDEVVSNWKHQTTHRMNIPSYIFNTYYTRLQNPDWRKTKIENIIEYIVDQVRRIKNAKSELS